MMEIGGEGSGGWCGCTRGKGEEGRDDEVLV